MSTIWIVLPILTLLMFDLGLALRFQDFGKVFRRPWPKFAEKAVTIEEDWPAKLLIAEESLS